MEKIIIAYIPALHEGYVKFLKNHSAATLYMISQPIINELVIDTPYFGRDMRAVNAETLLVAVRSMKIVKDVKLLDKKEITELQTFPGEIVMPTEDISVKIAQRYFSSKKISYDSIFLRWDKLISQKEVEVNPDRKISMDDMDKEIMGRAFKEAEKSSDWWRQIGSVLVKGEKAVLYSHNEHMPHEQSPYVLGDARSNFDAGVKIDLTTAIHSEVNLIAEAAKKGIATEGASIYVTTFPCPPCARAIAKAGIKKVYYSQGYSLLDAQEILKHFGVELILVKME